MPTWPCASSTELQAVSAMPHPQGCRLCPPCPHIWPCASSTGLQVRLDGKVVCEMEAMYHANGILDRTSECTFSGTPTEGDGTSQGGVIIHAGQHVEFVGACARGAKLEHPTDKRIGCIHLYIQLVPHHIATPHLIATPRTFSGQLKQHIGHTRLYTRLWLTLAARCLRRRQSSGRKGRHGLDQDHGARW